MKTGNWKDETSYAPPLAPYSWLEKEIRLRALVPESDENLIAKAWQWQFDKPRWWRESMKVWKPENFEEYLENSRRDSQVDYGIYIDNIFSGLITIVEIEPRIIEAHIDAPRNSDLSDLVNATKQAIQHVFDNGVREIYLYVCQLNKPILKLCTDAGFKRTNVNIIKGAIKKRVLIWEQLVYFKKHEK